MFLDWLMQKDVLTPLLAAAALLAVFLLRKVLAALLIVLIFSRLRRRNRERYQTVKAALLRPAAWLVVSGALRAAVGLAGIPEDFLSFAVKAATSLFTAAAIWLLYSAAGLAVASLIAASGQADSGGNVRKVSPTAVSFVSSAIQAVIIVLGILIILSHWVSNISGLITGFGIGGLAIALAAQDTASNLFGSIAIMLDKPFEVGDWIEVEGFMGVIEHVGLRSSRIRALDQSVVSIPNARLASSNIVNGTRRGRRRVAFKLGLVYATPIEKINLLIEKIKQILIADPEIENESTLVCLDGFASSAIEIFICYYTQSNYTLMMLAKERINFAILKAVDEASVAIAFPSVSVYQEKQAPAAAESESAKTV